MSSASINDFKPLNNLIFFAPYIPLRAIMGFTLVNLKVYGKERSKCLVAAVNTGFIGDLIARPEALEGLDVELKWERIRKLPDGRRETVKYGLGSMEIMGELTSVDVEVWRELELPETSKPS